MVQSMTGFASAQGADGAFQWMWDIRSVNAKGLDVRARVPDWLPGLEAEIKARIGKLAARGSVNLSLRLTRVGGDSSLTLNEAQLAATLTALARVEAAAEAQGLTLAQTSAGDILTLRGVMDVASAQDDPEAVKAMVLAQLDPLLLDFAAMRRSEGAALLQVLTGQIDQIDGLVGQAADIAETRKLDMQASFQAALARVADATPEPDRVAQEIALLAVKADVMEELDRLRAHVAAARALLAQDGPVGRKLDFLSQEFNREANTLCSKSQHRDLTAVGLELKVVIDQMREQVQNVE